MNVGSILSRAWQITWKHKVLWIFGILAGCTGVGSNGGNTAQYRTEAGQMPPNIERFFSQIPDGLIALIIIGAILIGLVIFFLAIFLGTIGKVGLIRSTAQVEGGATRLMFGDVFNGSMPYFWRVFGLNFLGGLLIAAAFIVVVLVGVFGTVLTAGIGLLCLIPLICLLVPLAWLASVWLEQATIAIVLENLGIVEAMKRGWEVLRNNLGSIVVMALILMLGVGLVGGLIIGTPLALMVVPVLIGTASSENMLRGSMVLAMVCFVAYLPFLLILNGILTTFTESAWTLTYMDLTRRPRSPFGQPAQGLVPEPPSDIFSAVPPADDLQAPPNTL